MSYDAFIIERIEGLCRERNMTRYRLAQKSGISQSSISNMLNRRNIPSINTLAKLCDGLGVTLAQFFSKDGKKIDLTEEQEYILDVWSILSDEEKLRVKAYIQGVRGQ